MTAHRIRLAVILGSTREGRFGHVVGRWFRRRAALRQDMDIDYVDLANLDIPWSSFQADTPELQAYAGRIGEADAIVVITPEYNHGYPGSLKQAIDLLRDEWRAKPVGFVSYGGISGGLRAVEQLRQVFAELHAVTIRDTVSFHYAQRRFDESGEPVDGDGPDQAATKMLDQLAWWASALRSAREDTALAA